jgi:hypothetical protein
MTLRRKIFVTFGITLLAAVALVLVYRCVFIPIKFRYLVRQVESARTAEEERRAFQLAFDWGRVWEVDRLSPNDMASAGRQLTGDYLLRLEWLECSPYGGRPYVAYRAVIDTNNLRVLFKSY